MAQDPYAAAAEGFGQGISLVGNLAAIRAKRDENIREQKKLAFDQMIQKMKTYAEVLKSDAPMQLRQAAANGILGMYKKHGSDMGLDPKALPEKITFDEDFAKAFASRVLSMNKLYEKKIIGQNNYRVGMFELSQNYKDMVGKENPDIMKMAENIASATPARFSAVQGEERGMFQETSPGSGEFSGMVDTSGVPIRGPAVQRVEMVKPPSESERSRIAEARADIDLYQSMDATVVKHPKWVGIGRDAWSKIAGKWDLMSQDQQEFYSTIRLNKIKDTKFFLGTAQSKQEARNAVAAIPDIGMGSKQLRGAIAQTKKNKERMLSRTLEVLRQSGLRVPEGTPPEAVLEIYNRAKAAGQINPNIKPSGTTTGGRPSLMAIFLEEEGKKD